MNDIPLISVIIPTYNRANLIKRSAESVLNQTYTNLELIIVDDGSTDNTKEVIASINDERVIYVKQENKGCCAARNNGINLARGKYIAFQDSDDVWLSDKLEKQIKKAIETNADVIFCKVFTFGNLRKRIQPKQYKDGLLNKRELPVGICGQTLFGKAKVFSNNKFDTTLKGLEDFEILLRLIKKDYSIYCLDDALVEYYVQQDSITTNSEKQIKILENILQKSQLADELYNQLKSLPRKLNYTALSTTAKTLSYSKDTRWKININENIEPDTL